MWRCARASTAADQFRRVILDRRDPLLFLRIPPFVGDDAVSAGVTAGKKCGVPRSGSGIGIVIIAIGEISPALEKHAKSTLAKLIAITLQVVPAKLVNYDYNHQPGMGIVSGRECARHQTEESQSQEEK